MESDVESPLFTPPEEVARCIHQQKDSIISNWDKAARHELRPARHQSEPALRDEMPKFVEALADGVGKIAEGHFHSAKGSQKEHAENHGQERAETPDYSLEQVLFEYHLLRDVISDALDDCKIKVSSKVMNSIHSIIDQAMGTAAQKFSDYRVMQEQANTARLEMEKKLRERFVNTLSHDLRTPLSAIYTSAQLLMRSPLRDEDRTRLTSRIINGIDRADRMIQDLLDANFIQGGGELPLKIGHYDLNEITQAAIDEIASIHGNRFKFQPREEVKGDWSAKELRRSIENLLTNAIKYGDPHLEVSVEVKREGDWATVSVHNWGNPVDSKDLPEIFRQFRRTESAQSSGKKGWGLGLTLVSGVASAHKGSVSVESTKEKGTTFTLRLPVKSNNWPLNLVSSPLPKVAQDVHRSGYETHLPSL